MERLSELVSETLGLFAKNFPVAYRDAVVENVKEEVDYSHTSKSIMFLNFDHV